MITKGQIERSINRAEAEFMDCWELLSEMKKGKLKENRNISLTQFQPKLATTIFDLTRSYREIEQEKNRRILEKNTYSGKWFRFRMRFLSNQQELLNRAISIGKGIGDAFAWFFYQRDRHYLIEHLSQQEQLHTPPGIGGAGELEFVKHVPLVDGFFVLYHGITNILRLGDLTLIDLKTFRVAGIGELKSQSVEPGKLEISLLFSGPKISKEIPRVDTPRPTLPRTKGNLEAGLSPSGRDRLKRQIKRISDSYKNLGGTPNKHLKVDIDGQFDALAEFIASLKPGNFSYKQFGKSLLFVGYKETKKTLYKKLSNSSQFAFADKLAGIEKHAHGLIANDRDDNAIIIESFFYDSNGKTRHAPGMSHLVWWPLSQKAIKSILFQDVIVFTLFNPAHLVSLLEKAGFSVEETGKFSYKVFKKRDGHEFVFEGMSYYLIMIQQYLFSEEEIISILRESEGQVESLYAGVPQKIELLIEQKFGRSSS